VTKPGVRIVGDKDRRHNHTILGRDSDR